MMNKKSLINVFPVEALGMQGTRFEYTFNGKNVEN